MFAKMKQTMLFFCVAMTTLLGGTIVTSCADADETGQFTDVEVKAVKAPDFKLYSGKTVLATTMEATRADVQVNVNYFKIQDWGGGKSDWMRDNYPVLYQYFDNAPAQTDRQEQVSQAEYDFVMAYLAAHPNEGGTTCDLTTYFIQNVGSSYDTYHLAFMNGDEVHHTVDITGGNFMDFAELTGTHINDYNATWGPRALCVDIPLTSARYHDSFYNLTQENHYRFYVIEYEGKNNLYLCYDYATTKYDNGLLDYQGDGVYNDWVIKIIPADGSEVTVPGGSDPNPDPVDPEQEEYNFYGKDHVEVNLSVNDKHDEGDWIHTKLSIHVRAVTDVEVFIPVSQDYYCDADDMAIVISHSLELEKYIPQPSTETFTITNDETAESWTVSATVAFEAGGIRVTTQGMTAELQQYLQGKYGDGLTFEVWNYYNVNAIDRETLKPYLDQSTVTFTSDPTLYVNAFAALGEDDHKNPWDCTVTPPADYSVYRERTVDPHGDYDVIYKK